MMNVTPEMTALIQGLFTSFILPLGWKLLGALAVWVAGGWVVRLMRVALGRFLSSRHVDATLTGYLDASANVLMRVLILVAVLGVLGIETSSFAALLAAVGVAIGVAWSGLLSNFAAGLFVMVLRPFKVGDMISGAGVIGVVREIGLFVTAVDTPDNVRTFVGNAKLFSETIQNFNTNPYRRVDLSMQLAHSVDPKDAITRMRERLARIPNVVTAPAPDVEILTFTPMGAVLAIRPYCHNDHYWQVYFDTNSAIVEVGGAAGYAAPETRMAVRNAS